MTAPFELAQALDFDFEIDPWSLHDEELILHSAGFSILSQRWIQSHLNKLFISANMILQGKQKREALASMREEHSPFRPTKTNLLFKNTANLSLRGTTYDATHLEKFLKSPYGDKNTATATPGRGATHSPRAIQSQLAATIASNNSIKPSIAFLGLKRDVPQFGHYVDLSDSPSTLLKLSSPPKISKTPFETEREGYSTLKTEALGSL